MQGGKLMTQYLQEISRRLRTTRKANDMFQDDVATILGCAKETISRIENQRTFPTRLLKKIEDFLSKYEKGENKNRTYGRNM